MLKHWIHKYNNSIYLGLQEAKRSFYQKSRNLQAYNYAIRQRHKQTIRYFLRVSLTTVST